MLTGLYPGASKEADLHDPRGPFGRFVKFALLSSPESENPLVQKLLDSFASFVEQARDYHEKVSDLPFEGKN
jgi:hypothetical protein